MVEQIFQKENGSVRSINDNERFGCTVENLDPFRSVTVDERVFPQETLAEIAPAAAVAVGLATRKAGDK